MGRIKKLSSESLPFKAGILTSDWLSSRVSTNHLLITRILQEALFQKLIIEFDQLCPSTIKKDQSKILTFFFLSVVSDATS